MKKFIYLFFIFYAFTSCKIIKLSSREELVMSSTNKEINFQFDDGTILIKGTIDKKPTTFLFDTGASNFVVFDTAQIPNYYLKDKIKLFKIKSGDGRKVTVDYVPIDIETDAFTFKNCLTSSINTQSYKCSSYKLPSIIGSAFLKKDTLKIISINFDQSKITFLDQQNDRTIPENYEEIKTKFFNKHFCLYLTINNIEEPFLFDTGNSFISILLNSKSKISLNNSIVFTGNETIAASGKTNLNVTNYSESFVSFNNYKIQTTIAQSDLSKTWYNNVGINFIKKFNWIVDYKNKKVYVSKSHFYYDYKNETPKYSYLVTIREDKIIIFSKTKNEKLNIGDEIISINNQKITPENICEMQDLLNKTEDWETLNVEVKSN